MLFMGLLGRGYLRNIRTQDISGGKREGAHGCGLSRWRSDSINYHDAKRKFTVGCRGSVAVYISNSRGIKRAAHFFLIKRFSLPNVGAKFCVFSFDNHPFTYVDRWRAFLRWAINHALTPLPTFRIRLWIPRPRALGMKRCQSNHI